MRKILFQNLLSVLMIIIVVFTTNTVISQVGTPSFYNAVPTATANSFPLNSTTSNKVQWIYAPGVFTSDGTPGGTPLTAGNLITKIYIRIQSVNTTTTYQPDFSISMTQTGTSNVFSNATFLTGLINVFQSSAFQFTGIATASWYGIPLTTPFLYDPTMSLIVELKTNNATAGGNSVNSITTTGLNQRVYGAYGSATGTAGAGLTPIGFDVTTASPCTIPPFAGNATSTLTNACNGENFTLNLSNNTTGTGQTYQWQSSLTGFAPWTNIGSNNISAAYNTSQTTSTYYRCEVTCSGSSVYSDSIQITSPTLVNGNFTINSSLPTSSSNFISFTDAIDYIKCGINGPVEFTVAPGTGPYIEQVVIPDIYGTSSTNTITIKGNGNTLSYTSSNTANRAGIHLNGADHVTIDSLIIDGSAGTYAWGIVLTNTADSNTIKNCVINIGNVASTSINYAGIVLNGSATGTAASGNNGNGNLFYKNEIIGGYYGFYIYGNSTGPTLNNNNQIIANTIKDSYFYGIYAIYQSSGFVVSKNEIYRPTRSVSSTIYGINISTATVGALIEKNKIHNMFELLPASTSVLYSIYVSADANSTTPTRVENNLITTTGGNGTTYGIYSTGSDYLNIYHNTIVLDDAIATTGATYGIYQTTLATGVNIKNNIVLVSRSGTGAKRCLYFVTNTSTISSDNNVLFMNASSGTNNHLGQWGAINYTTFTDWKTANTNAYDQNSVNDDPLFINPFVGDFTPGNSNVDDVGAIVGVLTDINDSTRSTSNPDPGAFEIPPVLGTDIKTDALILPTESVTGCYNTETIRVRIKNNGTDPIDLTTKPVTITVNITGAVTLTYSALVNSGILLAGDTISVLMTTPGSTINMSTIGTYTFTITSSVTSDVNSANNELIVERIKLGLTGGIATASPDNTCISNTTLPTLNASSVEGFSSVKWQSSTTSGVGFSDIANSNDTSFVLSTSPTQTLYYRLVATCGSLEQNSSEVVITVNNPQISLTTPGTRCGPGTVNLSATPAGAATINWYNSASGGLPISTGNTFTTPTITSTTTYYAAASEGGSTMNVGKAAPVTALNLLASPRGIQFDALTPFILNSVTVFSTSATAGSGIITLYDNTNTAINTVSVSWPGGGSTASPVPQVLSLNLSIPTGTGYKLMMTTFTTGGIAYESSGMSVAAYAALSTSDIAFVGSMTSLTSLSTTAYYYFYDWSISTGCEGVRTPVTATITSAPTITVTSTIDTICSLGTSTLSVSSSNLNYTYNWTPNGVTGSTAIVSPSATTKYYVNANDAGSGCTALDSLTIFVQNTPTDITATVPSFCVTGGSTLLKLNPLTEYAGNYVQWQTSSNGISYSDISGATGTSYTTPVFNDSSYFRALVKNEIGTVCSQTDILIPVSKPLITSTTPNYHCGAGTVTIGATANAGALINWYSDATGGAILATGNSFTTPTLSTTTTYYAAASLGSGGAGTSALLITELDLGTNDRLEIQNVSPASLDVTGWKVVLSNSYTDINSVNANIKTLTGTLLPGETIAYTDATGGPNYWGSNILWNPGAFPTFTGWALILDNNDVVKDAVFLNWPSANIQAMSITVNSAIITIGSQWTGNGIDITTVAATDGVSRKGLLDDNSLNNFEIIPLTIGTTNTNLTVPMSGFACESSPRTPVIATIDNDPGCSAVPVNLLYFTGNKLGNINKLNWTTLTEQNNIGFELQRSADGNNFSKIGFINAANNGNSNNSNSYQFIDEQPLKGNNYYRLKQMDKDGKFNLSNIVLLKGNSIAELTITEVYPNPVKNNITIKIHSPKAEKANVVITDATGKVILQQNCALTQGVNNIKMQMSSIAKGNYLLKVICASGCESKTIKVIKE
jgi:hypothetical protein